MNLNQGGFEPRVKPIVIGPLNNPKPERCDRILEGIYIILSRFSSKFSKHSYNATRSSCFSSIAKYPVIRDKAYKKIA